MNSYSLSISRTTDESLKRVLLNDYSLDEIRTMTRAERERNAREILDEIDSARREDVASANYQLH